MVGSPIAPLAQLQFAQAPDMGAQIQALTKNLGAAKGAIGGPAAPVAPVDPGAAIPGATGPTAAGGPNGPQPLVAPGVTPQGPTQAGAPMGSPAAAPGQPTGILQALQGLQPQQILDVLRGMSANGQKVIPPGMPGSAALGSAGMLGG